MVQECQHVYETGRKCRRIPKRGDALCPGHRPNPRRSVHDEPDFQRRIAIYVQQLRQVDNPSLFAILQDALTAIQPIIERKSSRANYLPFARASVVVAIAGERLVSNRQPANATGHPERSNA